MGKFLRKAFLLACILLVLAVLAGPILTPNWATGDACFGKTTKAYLDLPEDAASVITVGSSQILRGIDTAAMSGQGIDAFCRATAVQSPAVTYYYTKEAIEHHDVKLVLADFSFLYDAYDPDEYEPYIRYAFDYMPLSVDKIKAIRGTLGQSQQSIVSYLLPVLRYHERWHSLTADDFSWPFAKCTDENNGSMLLDDVFDGTRKSAPSLSADYIADNLYWYKKTISLCQENNIPFLLLRLPREDWNEARMEADAAFASDNHVDFLDFNDDSLYKEIGFDKSTDFVDPNHLNRSGAEKLTSYLCDYLFAHYTDLS